MATLRTNLVCDSSTVANFKAWGSYVSSAWSTFGWTQTADTGQVNWGTIVSAPTAGNFVYEIWKAADTLSGTYPLYVKMEYGTSSSNSTAIIRITIGTGSNGSGTLVNPTTALIGTIGAATASTSTTVFDCWFSGDSGRMQFCLWRNHTTPIIEAISVERSVDSTGTPNSDFIYATLVSHRGSSQNLTMQGVLASGTVGTNRVYQETNINNDVSTFYSGYAAVFATRPVIAYERNALLGMLRGAVNEWIDLDTPTITIYTGYSSHAYVVFKTNMSTFGSTVGGNNVLLMRYE